MLIQLFDKNTREPTGYLRHAKEIKIESTLSDGDERLSFLVPRDTAVHNEDYLRTKDNEYVVKLLSPQSDTHWMPVEATLNTEDLEGKEWKAFESVEQTAQACLNLAFAGTGWTVQLHGDLKKKRTIRMTGSSWEVLQQALKTYRYETRLDAREKVCHLYEQRGEDKGVYFKDGLNLKKLAVQSDSYDFYTRIRPEGKEGLTIADINGGKDYLENHGYSTKVKTLYWKDERYTVAQNLKEDAEAKLAELAAPAVAYTTEVRDLAAMKPETYTILSYGIGDVITLIDKATLTHEEQRIVKLVRYPDTPWKNTCEIANRAASFDTVQQEQSSVNTTVNNITSTNDLIAASALEGVIESSSFGQLIVQDLTAVTARIGHLEATTAEITELYAKKAYVSELLAGYAKITELDVTNARIENAEIKVADIETLVNGNLTSDNILSLILTSDKVTADTLFVKTQIASQISVNDLVAGTIYTEKQKIMSEDGALLIQGPTMQFKDENNKVRLQIGRDAYGHFNFILIGEDPTKGAILDQDGIHTGAVPDGLIVDIMISDNANIGGNKLNIPSLVTEINGNTETIKSSLIAYDPTGQTLDVLLGQLKTTTDNLDSITESLETSIGIQQGKIDGLISDSVIVNSDGTTTKLKDAFTSFKITLEGLQTTVTDHESRFGDYATTSAMTSAITQAKNEITTTVSQTYVTKNTLDNYSTTEQMNSAIQQKGDSILLAVSQTYVTEAGMEQAFGFYWSASETATAINQKANEISLTVSEKYSTKTETEEVVNRLSDAELKLQPDKITASVSQAITSGSAIKTSKYILDAYGFKLFNADFTMYAGNDENSEKFFYIDKFRNRVIFTGDLRQYVNNRITMEITEYEMQFYDSKISDTSVVMGHIGTNVPAGFSEKSIYLCHYSDYPLSIGYNRLGTYTEQLHFDNDDVYCYTQMNFQNNLRIKNPYMLETNTIKSYTGDAIKLRSSYGVECRNMDDTAYANLTAKTVVQTSDKAAKCHIEPLTDRYAVLEECEFYTYQFKDDGPAAERSLGLVIGEGCKVSEKLLVHDEQGQAKGINLYSYITATAAYATQLRADTQSTLEDYRLRLEALEQENAELRARLQALENQDTA